MNQIHFYSILFMIVTFKLYMFRLNYCQLVSDTSSPAKSTDPSLVLIEFNSTDEIILAEPDTLLRLRQAFIGVKSSRALDYDLNLVWRIEPVDNRKFQETEGFVRLVKNTSLVVFSIRSKNTGLTSLNSIVYRLYLNKVLPDSNSTDSGTIIKVLDTNFISIRILPANYPFGFFQFAENFPLNRTVSR